MSLPTVAVDERIETRPNGSEEDAIEDNFRHIVCFLCYPAFAAARAAPHDARCVCGKQIQRGADPGPVGAPECILCNEMADPHYRFSHSGGSLPG